MKCPLTKPVYKDKWGEIYFCVREAEGYLLTGGISETKADYIVQAINSYEKAVELIDEIEAVSCGETQIECDGAYDDSDGMLWIHKRIQALKQTENQNEKPI